MGWCEHPPSQLCELTIWNESPHAALLWHTGYCLAIAFYKYNNYVLRPSWIFFWESEDIARGDRMWISLILRRDCALLDLYIQILITVMLSFGDCKEMTVFMVWFKSLPLAVLDWWILEKTLEWAVFCHSPNIYFIASEEERFCSGKLFSTGIHENSDKIRAWWLSIYLVGL